jgi:hypothetical protein
MSFDNDLTVLTVGQVAEKICSSLPVDVSIQCLTIINDIVHLEINEVNCITVDDLITDKQRQVKEQDLSDLSEYGEDVLKFLKQLENKCYFYETAL